MLAVRRMAKEAKVAVESAAEYAPPQYSFWTSTVLTIKLLMIAGGVLALIWAADVVLAP